MPDPEAVVEVARSWLRGARSDLVMSRKALADRDAVDPWVASFHAQQAAEKTVKAALVIEQIRFPRTHDATRRARSTRARSRPGRTPRRPSDWPSRWRRPS